MSEKERIPDEVEDDLAPENFWSKDDYPKTTAELLEKFRKKTKEPPCT
jgi:hypothetical protein